MHKLFWVFSTFLIILTIISALGGGIRFRENFMDELFDTINDLSTNSDMDIVNDEMLKATIENEYVEEEQSLMENDTVAEAPEAPVGKMSEIVEDAKIIEAFDGETFASFS